MRNHNVKVMLTMMRAAGVAMAEDHSYQKSKLPDAKG
ncbi:MAG: hypothetical protein JWP63_3434, partial [Candidatus Solibacter sp.]|nr:hypothetical protein [Candidatus Solibacter sp.]